MSLLHFDILDHVAVPIFVLRPDRDRKVVYAFWNRAAERMGNRRREDVLGKSALEVYSGAFAQAAYNRHVDVFNTGRSATYELMLDINGAPQEVQTTLSPVKSFDGSVLVAIGTSVIMSALRAAQQREIEQLAMIEATKSEMESYLAFAAHDLRSPMRRMLGLAELMQEELPDDAGEAREIAQMMEQVSQKAEELIGEVLEFNLAVNATSGTEDIDLGTLCRDIFLVLDPMQLHDLEAMPARLHGDKVALQIILRNLVDNALKHTDKSVVRVRIEHTYENGTVWIIVADNGPGLPEDQLDFFEGQTFTYGNGFGLLGIRRLVQMRRGELHADTPPEGGTRFRLTLPGLVYSDDSGIG
jgi:signal transduction histidine kinase